MCSFLSPPILALIRLVTGTVYPPYFSILAPLASSSTSPVIPIATKYFPISMKTGTSISEAHLEENPEGTSFILFLHYSETPKNL